MVRNVKAAKFSTQPITLDKQLELNKRFKKLECMYSRVSNNHTVSIKQKDNSRIFECSTHDWNDSAWFDEQTWRKIGKNKCTFIRHRKELRKWVQQKSATRNEYASCAWPTTDIGTIAAKPKSYASELSNSSLCILWCWRWGWAAVGQLANSSVGGQIAPKK